MKYPLDSSDEASFILADYLEEYDDINLANEIRNSVLEPNTNNWCYKYRYIFECGIYGIVNDDDVGGFGCSVGDCGVVFTVDVGSGFGVGVGAWAIGDNVGYQ